MGQQVGTQLDLQLQVNDFTLILPSFSEMIWLTVGEKQIPLFVSTKSISRSAELSLTVFLLSKPGPQSTSAHGMTAETARELTGGSSSHSSGAASVKLFRHDGATEPHVFGGISSCE